MKRFAQTYKRSFDTKFMIGDKLFNCWIADTFEKRQTGLMQCRLQPMQACVLDFGRPTEVSLWMKNCLEPLVALFLSIDTGEVQEIKYMDLEPNKMYRGSNLVCYIIEIRPDDASSIKIGDPVYLYKDASDEA